MATDARIAVGLPTHPKTKKLIRRLGQGAAWNFVCLLLWAAANRSDGDLADMSVEDIELAAEWTGDDGVFVAALSDVRFLDRDEEGQYRIHDWTEHNPWAAGSDMRRAKARWNAAKRHHGAAEADRLVPEYAAARSATSKADSKAPAEGQDAAGSAPSPSPSPSPIPTSPSSLRSEGESANAAQSLPTTDEGEERRKTLKTYLAECKADGRKPIPEGHAVHKWAKDAGLSDDMLQIAWLQFREKYTESEKGKGKLYKDWPGHFATAVKANWFKLWYQADDGMHWSSLGMTHRAVLDARISQREVANAVV